MSEHEHELASRIVRRLERGLDDIDPRTLQRLRSARTAAVERMQAEPVPALSWASDAGLASLLRHFSPRYLAPILGMVLTVSAMVYWQQAQRIEDPVDIDARLLSSDLPIDALLDTGLDTWLQR